MKRFWSPKANLSFIFLVFLFSRLLDFTIVYLASTRLNPSNFPYEDILSSYRLHHLFNAFANFDGIQYITIAKEGYYNFTQAYFPLYPLILRFTAPLFNSNYVYVGIFISSMFFLATLILLGKYMRLIDLPENKIAWLIIFIAFFPTSFFFGAIYPSSFLLFCFVGVLYLIKVNKNLLAFILAFLFGLSRIEAILLPFAFLPFFIKSKFDIKKFAVAVAPLFGLATYSYYLFKTRGDALYFLHSLTAFDVNRSTSIVLLPQVLYRYVKIFITATHNFQFYISVLEFSVFISFFLIAIYFFVICRRQKGENKREFLVIGIFSLLNLILPTLTGTLTSLPRYALSSLAVFMVLSFIKNDLIKILLLIFFVIFHIILLSYFSQGYFIS